MEPDLPDMPEHYDLENASSIAPSDIDIVYHYKGYRETGGGRNKSSPFRHSHHFSGNRPSPGIRQSPISNVLKSTPLARLSPSSELSQQTAPRILTLQDISGKPLQSALLATAHQKDAMSQSERSLNISQSSTRSSLLNPSRPGTKKRKQCSGETSSNMTIGLTAEEVERLNNSRHKNNSSLVSTLDAASSSESESRLKGQLSNLREGTQELSQGAGGESSSEDRESGNDSFSCSEFEYDNEKRDNFHAPRRRISFPTIPQVPAEGEGSLGSLSTVVASDDDLAYVNGYRKGPKGSEGPSTEGWNYLMSYMGPNYSHSPLTSVFKNMSELPECPRGPSLPPHPPQGSGMNNLGASRSSRYPTPRPSEEYV
jgi:protocadherin Fat 4